MIVVSLHFSVYTSFVFNVSLTWLYMIMAQNLLCVSDRGNTAIELVLLKLYKVNRNCKVDNENTTV